MNASPSKVGQDYPVESAITRLLLLKACRSKTSRPSCSPAASRSTGWALGSERLRENSRRGALGAKLVSYIFKQICIMYRRRYIYPIVGREIVETAYLQARRIGSFKAVAAHTRSNRAYLLAAMYNYVRVFTPSLAISMIRRRSPSRLGIELASAPPPACSHSRPSDEFGLMLLNVLNVTP